MHELSIAMSILDVVEEECARRGEGRVAAIHLKLGALSGVVKESLLSAFELAREETDMKDCDLLIEEIPIVVYCPACGTERSVVSIQSICCAVCGTPTPEIVTGRELEVSAMELCNEKADTIG
jgi:hydrogenase nickel incorporation protein HypA/HybF